MVDMKHVALLSVKQIQGFEKKKDKLFKDPAMTFHYKITVDAAKFKRRIETLRIQRKRFTNSTACMLALFKP